MQKKMGVLLLLVMGMTALTGCKDEEDYPKSEVIIDETYKLEGTDNMEFAFSKDSTLTVLQEGIYELKINEEGKPLVRICLDDISRELPEDYGFTDYVMQARGKNTVLTFTSEEFSLDTSPMVLVPIKGKDGLLQGANFDGTYQIGDDGDSYQYIFERDGTVTMQIKQHYYADGTKMTLSDYAGDTEYYYEEDGEKLTLKNMENEPVLELVVQ